MVKITSDASATALGLSAHAAPAASSGSAFDRVRLNTVAAKPARSKWPHMLVPITPVPIQPMRVLPGCTISIVVSVKEADRSDRLILASGEPAASRMAQAEDRRRSRRSCFSITSAQRADS